MKKPAILLLVILAAASCTRANNPSAEKTPGPSNVLVVINEKSETSKEVGEYYAQKRGIAEKFVLRIECPDKERIDTREYELIQKPVKERLDKGDLKIDYIVLTKGVPFALSNGFAVDSLLASMEAGLDPRTDKGPLKNPYFGQADHFSHEKYGLYLVTRLDGYTKEDAKALVDRALAAKPEKQVFLFDVATNQTRAGYKEFNEDMRKAHEVLKGKGFVSMLETTEDFVGRRKNLMGYCSWGSNDGKFDLAKYRGNQFLPGSIAETAVSTSARTFVQTDEGQSLIGDLIKSGVTGVKGYCNEPTLTAVAIPSILFDRYVSGYNLAESFYMASRCIYWRDIVIGDPLTAPYAGEPGK